MVFEKVRSIICEQLELDIDDVALTSDLEDLDADSLDLVDIVMSLEDEFSIEIPDSVLESFTCVADVVNFIENS